MSGTGLSPDQDEYRRRLDAQADAQIDAWSAELMRDMSIRRGVLSVLRDLMTTSGLTERELERVYAAGGGAPATVGRTEDARIMIPAVALHHLVPGLRREMPDGRERLIRYLVENFHEIVYI